MTEIFRFVLDPGSEAGRWLTRVTLYWTGIFAAWLALLLLYFTVEWTFAFVVSLRAKKAAKRSSRAQPAKLAEELGKRVPFFFLLRRRIKRIVDLRYDVSGLVPQLSAIDSESVEASLAIPKFAAGVPIMFGLLGTLLGLTDAIVQIQPLLAGVKDINDLPQLLGAMIGTLGGMKTAFSASMAGLVATLVLSFLATLTSWMAARALVAIDKATSDGLVPLLAVSEWQTAATRFSEALTENTKTVERVSGTMEGWSKQVSEALGKLDQSGDNLRGAAKDIQESTTAMVGQQGTFNSHIAQLTASTNDIRGVLTQIQSAIAQVQTKGESAMDRETLVRTLGEMQTAVVKIAEKVERVAQGSPQVFGEALRAIKQEARQDLVNFFDSVEDGFSKRIEEFRGSTQQLVAALHANQEAMMKAFGASAGGAARGAPPGGFFQAT